MANGSEKIKSWIEATARMLADDPSQIRIEEVLSPDEGTSYFTIYCANNDFGKILGKSGDNVGALRKLAGAMTMAIYRRRCEISMHDPRPRERSRDGR